MRNKINNGGAAFPRPMSCSNGGVSEHQFVSGDQDGMTYRQRLAVAVLQGILANPEWNEFPNKCAVTVIDFADALIAELEKEEV